MKKNTDYPKWKIFLDLGKRNLKLNQKISANNALSKSISIKQDNYLSFYYRGQALHRLKNYTLAIKDPKKSLKFIFVYFSSLFNCFNHLYFSLILFLPFLFR